MPAQSPGTIVNAGMPGVEMQPKDAACAAFSAAIDRYCAPDERARRQNKYAGKDRKAIKTFEEFFTEELARTTKDTLRDEKAPKPTDLALEPKDRKIAARLLATGGASSMKSYAMLADDRDKGASPTPAKIKSTFGNPYGNGTRKFLDGEIKGVAIELKGPGDTDDPKGSFAKYKQVEKDKKSIAVGCRSCGKPCKKGNSC